MRLQIWDVLVFEFVGTFFLDKVSEKYDKSNISFYRNGGLLVFNSKSGTQLERTKVSLHI